jgi:hypothetical protein
MLMLVCNSLFACYDIGFSEHPLMVMNEDYGEEDDNEDATILYIAPAVCDKIYR